MGGCCCCSSRTSESDRAPVHIYSSVIQQYSLSDGHFFMQKGEKKNMLKSYSALALCLHLIFQSVKLTLLCIIQHRQNPEEHEPLSSDFDGAPPTSAIVAVDTNLDTSTLDTYRAPPAPLPYDVGLTVAENPDLGKSDTKIKTEGQQSPKVGEFESCEKGTPEDKPDEEDVCPICLEEYDEENPRSMTKCDHHFHLCCILEWMERSDTCPVCDQITLIDEMYE